MEVFDVSVRYQTSRGNNITSILQALMLSFITDKSHLTLNSLLHYLHENYPPSIIIIMNINTRT